MIIVEKNKNQLVIGSFLPDFAFHFDILDIIVAHGCNWTVHVAQLYLRTLDRGVESPRGFNGIP